MAQRFKKDLEGLSSNKAFYLSSFLIQKSSDDDMLTCRHHWSDSLTVADPNMVSFSTTGYRKGKFVGKYDLCSHNTKIKGLAVPQKSSFKRELIVDILFVN